MGIRSPIKAPGREGVTPHSLAQREAAVAEREREVELRENTFRDQRRQFDADMQRRIEAVTQRELEVSEREKALQSTTEPTEE